VLEPVYWVSVRTLYDEDRVQLVFRPHSDTRSERVTNQHSS
jgi:hypothetical protein